MNISQDSCGSDGESVVQGAFIIHLTQTAPPQSPDLNQTKSLWDTLVKTSWSGAILPPTTQNLMVKTVCRSGWKYMLRHCECALRSKLHFRLRDFFSPHWKYIYMLRFSIKKRQITKAHLRRERDVRCWDHKNTVGSNQSGCVARHHPQTKQELPRSRTTSTPNADRLTRQEQLSVHHIFFSFLKQRSLE